MVPYIATVKHQLPLGIITLHLRLVEVLEVRLALDEGDLLHLGVVAGGVAGGEPHVALHHDRLLAQPSLLLTQTTFMIIRRHLVNLVFLKVAFDFRLLCQQIMIRVSPPLYSTMTCW